MDSHQRRIIKRLLQQCGVSREDAGRNSSAKGLLVKVDYKPPNQFALGFFLGALISLLPILVTWGSYPTARRLEIILLGLFAFGLYPAICLIDYVGHRIHATRKKLLRFVVGILLAATVAMLGWASWPSPPTITMQISPLALPLFIPAHSVASVLQVHPYISPTDKQDDLLKIANDTGTEGCWPSQAEMDSLGANEHETIYHLEISNHSQRILESGKLKFALKYNSGSKGSSCLAPSGTQPYQEDVVLLSPIDPGKSFDFFAVNQSNLCAWLIPPSSTTVVMDGDEKEGQVPLTFDKNPLYAAGVPSFFPTEIKWEGVPSRPGGYGIIRTGSRSCESK